MSQLTAAWFGLAALAAAAVAQPANAQTVLFEGARLIAGDSSAALENSAILVERGTITRIGRSGEMAAPAGSTRIDLARKTVMPAIIATHVHPGFQSGLTYLAENFKRETSLPGSSASTHLIERFTRTDAKTLLYEFTVTDPTMWTRPWTAVVPMAQSEDPIYEYACHEGNHALSGILAGARADEKAAEEAAKKGSK